MSNTSIHEFDVALSPGIASPATAARQTAREIHLNVWLAGVKGSPALAEVGNSAVTPTTGIQVVQPRPTAALANAPAELILGDTSAAPSLMNLLELYGITLTANSTFTGFGIP